MKKKTNTEVVFKLIDKQFNMISKDIDKIKHITDDITMKMAACYIDLNEAIKLEKED